MPFSTSAMATAATSGETPGGGSSRAMSKALAGVRVGAVLHPAVMLAFADGVGFQQHADRPAAQRPESQA
jgi:hypothetical protein